MDAYSKWVEIFPTAKPNTITVAKAICKTIIPTHEYRKSLDQMRNSFCELCHRQNGTVFKD